MLSVNEFNVKCSDCLDSDACGLTAPAYPILSSGVIANPILPLNDFGRKEYRIFLQETRKIIFDHPFNHLKYRQFPLHKDDPSENFTHLPPLFLCKKVSKRMQYVKAREELPANDRSAMIIVDERPYLPNFVVTLADAETSAMGDIVSQIVPGAVAPFQMQRVAGGVTNTLFKVSWKSSSDGGCTSVLVRLFGAEGMIDRDHETAVFAQLAQGQIAPHYYGRFANGRIEGWLDNMRALTDHKELIRYGPAIAAAMARLHNFKLSGDACESSPHESPNLWRQLWGWWEQAKTATFPTEDATNMYQKLQIDVLRSEIEQLHAIVETSVPKSTIVFCHNDLLAANVMINNNDNADSVSLADHSHDNITIQLIDFEYGGYNYRSFDIANHFNEYAGGPPDHADPEYELFPDDNAMRSFITAYLKQHQMIANATEDTNEDDNDAIDAMVFEVRLFVLINHLYWGLWSVNQAATEGCEQFDFLRYATNRIRQYWIVKEQHQELFLPN
jgi:ethanolamine kinase